MHTGGAGFRLECFSSSSQFFYGLDPQPHGRGIGVDDKSSSEGVLRAEGPAYTSLGQRPRKPQRDKGCRPVL
jgi:hypothetical protein